ncbi:hypothetical protein ACFVOR_23080 [Streptomyces sp. NPDC057837]|uniref:hypothetical protein n=1 Tax=Streptomyces sp. NPDC057837 TaxID=3346260 RepID=UPI0036809178
MAPISRRRSPGRGVAVLAAVLLTLLTALGGVPPGPAAGPPSAAVAAAGHPGTGPRADDDRDGTCAVRAAARHESPGEPSPPRCPAAVGARRTDAPAALTGAPSPARATPLTSVPPCSSPDLERAPPRRPAPDAPFPSS